MSNGLMMLMAATAKRTLTYYSFPAGTSTWTCPSTTFRVETVRGLGGPGVPAVPPAYGAHSVGVCGVTFNDNTSSALPNSGPLTWYAYSAAWVAARDAINSQAGSSTGPATFSSYVTTVNRTVGGVYSYQESSSSGLTTFYGNILPGSATLSFTGQGPGGSFDNIGAGSGSFTGQARVDFQYLLPGTGTPDYSGSATSGFGYSFPGGTGSTPAEPSTGGAVTTSPGTVHTATVATGGYLEISYYV